LPDKSSLEDKELSEVDRINLAKGALERGIILVMVNFIDK
jgi:hypothetical protein